jgi:hypothetical protein
MTNDFSLGSLAHEVIARIQQTPPHQLLVFALGAVVLLVTAVCLSQVPAANQ